MSDSGCVTRVLFPFCSGYGECGGVLATYCNDTRGNASACAACVAAAPWAMTNMHPAVDPLHQKNASCSATEVAAFCESTAGLPRDTSAATCDACAAKLARTPMQCHILHEPVETLPVLKCEGCDGGTVGHFCSTLAESVVTHEYCWETRSADPSKCQFGLPLEQSFVVRGVSLFDPMSSRVLAGTVRSFSNRTTELLREFFFGVLEAQTLKYPHGGYRSTAWGMWGSENIDTSDQATIYLALDALARLPGYRNKTLPDGRAPVVHLAEWEAFWYQWLKARATGGLFVELASTGHWARTWPNMLNLVDLPTSDRVKKRAKMFVDLAMLEAEQASIAGIRGGQKSWAKRDDVTANMYPAITPILYGTNLSAPSINNSVLPGIMNSGLIQAIAGDCQMSNVSVLVHTLGVAPSSDGKYLLRNRLIGQIDRSQVVLCDPARCANTLRPSPCYCEKGSESGLNQSTVDGPGYVMKNVSDQVHTIWRTPSYLLGGVAFSPNDFFSANTQQRWVGLIFSNRDHTSLGMPHLTGEKWALIDNDIGIFHKCATCNYGGNSVVDIFNATRPAPLPAGCPLADATKCWRQRCVHCGCSAGLPPCPPEPGDSTVRVTAGWVFVSVVDNDGAPSFAAVRSVWGGDVPEPAGAVSMTLTPNDTWAPIIILTGRSEQHGSAESFSTAVLATGLAIRPGPHRGAKEVSLSWNGKRYLFHAQNATGRYVLPEIDGRAVNISPPFQYFSPHMSADLGAEVVTAAYPGYTLEYRFKDGADAIVRVSEAQSA